MTCFVPHTGELKLLSQASVPSYRKSIPGYGECVQREERAMQTRHVTRAASQSGVGDLPVKGFYEVT